jgi:drug/metabolite transporter (DMT)-like permease
VLFILVFLIATGSINSIASLTVSQLGWIIFTSVLLFAYVTSWYAGLKLVPASRAACVLVLGSAVTTLLSFFYSGSVTLSEIVGAALISSGVLVMLGYSYIASKLRLIFPSRNKN